MQEQPETEHEAEKAGEGQSETLGTSLRQAKEQKQSRCQKTREYFCDWHNAVSTLTLLFVAAYTVITLCILRNAEEQVRISRDTERRQLRAYVAISTTTPPMINAAKVEFTVDNFGLTPAKDVHVFGNWEFVPIGQPLPTNFTFPDKPTCDGALGSFGMQPTIGNLFPKNPASSIRWHCPELLANLQRTERKEMNGFFYGRIEYVDIFNEPRSSNFCMLWLIDQNITLVCDRHNEIDP